MSDDLSNFSLIELFRVEAEGQIALLTRHLLDLERGPAGPEVLEAMMRAAHSLKGAARIVDLGATAALAHTLEECFVAAQNGALALSSVDIDLLLLAVDAIARSSQSEAQGTLADRGVRVSFGTGASDRQPIGLRLAIIIGKREDRTARLFGTDVSRSSRSTVRRLEQAEFQAIAERRHALMQGP